jgi:3-deoxy-7-phosphoheptulonate synthase
MLESHLSPGRQEIGAHMRYGVSITDACLGFEDSRVLLHELAQVLAG